MSKKVQGVLGLGLLVILAIPSIRQMMEASMWRHMLLQFPLWIGAAALLAGGAPVQLREIMARWNRLGISGLCLAGVILAVLMIPRVLDQALLYPEIEASKLIALILAGVALRLSWQSAGLIVQFFFLGNMLPMMGVIGWLYTESPQRLCNAYLLDDQIQLGNGLIAVAIATAIIWLSWVAWLITVQEIHQTSQHET
jgi:hypothetical protein